MILQLSQSPIPDCRAIPNKSRRGCLVMPTCPAELNEPVDALAATFCDLDARKGRERFRISFSTATGYRPPRLDRNTSGDPGLCLKSLNAPATVGHRRLYFDRGIRVCWTKRPGTGFDVAGAIAAASIFLRNISRKTGTCASA